MWFLLKRFEWARINEILMFTFEILLFSILTSLQKWRVEFSYRNNWRICQNQKNVKARKTSISSTSLIWKVERFKGYCTVVNRAWSSLNEVTWNYNGSPFILLQNVYCVGGLVTVNWLESWVWGLDLLPALQDWETFKSRSRIRSKRSGSVLQPGEE